MRQAWWMVCSVVLMVISVGQVGWAQPAYRAEPLAIFGLAISDSGTIGGFRTGPQGTIQAAMQLTTGEVVTPMPEEAGVTTLVVDIDPGPLALIAWASERHASGDTARGYTYDHRSKRLTRLRHLPGARSCLPHAMNWSLQIVGECDSQAVYWRCATCAPTNLHRPDRWFGSVASAINRKGTLVLRAYYTDPPECGDCPATALYRRVASRTIVELPQPWGYVGGVSDINGVGVVVG